MPSLAQKMKMQETENVDLKRQLADAKADVEDAEARADNAEVAATVASEALEAAPKAAHTQVTQEPTLLRDPFDEISTAILKAAYFETPARLH